MSTEKYYKYSNLVTRNTNTTMSSIGGRSRRSGRAPSRAGSSTSAKDTRYETLYTKMQSTETRLQSMVGENETLKRDNTRLRQLQRDRVNLNVLDDEAGASDAKVIALQNLHGQKVRALMISIEKYKVEVKNLSSKNRESSRSRQIQGLQSQLRGAELVADVLKETLTTANEPMSPQDVNDLVIRKTLGGPKRFRPKTREELQNQVNDLELKYKRAFAKAEKTKMMLRDEQENSRSRLNGSTRGEGKTSSGDYGSKTSPTEGKTQHVSSSSSYATAARVDHSSRVVELLGQLEEMRAQTEVKDRQIRMYVSKVENLHESKRELLSYKDKYERSKSKLVQQNEEIDAMHQEEILLRRKLERTKETALRLEAEVDVQKEEGMVANQDVGRQRLKDMQRISELTEDLAEVRMKLDLAEKAGAAAHQKRLQGTQTLESTMSTLKGKKEKLSRECQELKGENKRLQQKLDDVMEESQKTLQSTTFSTQSKLAEQERRIKKLTMERDDGQKEIVRHETASKNLEAQLNRAERANIDRVDKLEKMVQSKETELREMEKERSDLEHKQADARRSAKEAESKGETGMKQAMEEIESLREQLEEEGMAREQLQAACDTQQKQLKAAKIKVRKLDKLVKKLEGEVSRGRSGSGGGGGQKSKGGGPASRTPVKEVVEEEEAEEESEEESEEEDEDAIMNA